MEILAVLLGLLFGLMQQQLGLDGDAGSSGVTVDLEAAAEETRSDLPLPRIYGARGTDRPLVVIDAGHGGRDPGAISPHGAQREKNVTLALALAIRDELAAGGRVRVALTRENDSFLPLRDRYEIARRLKAQLFISVHADAAPNRAARGATIYTLSEVASDREAALLATRENTSDIIGGVDLGSTDADVNRILIDLAQRESMDVSTRFANLLYREASPIVPFREGYHRFASLIVLKAPDIPSILFEAGYLTHAEDVTYIHSREGQREIALGMRRAIEAHFARRLTESRAVNAIS
jgi:N-acetylmuramoyl-L-alanine amidase